MAETKNSEEHTVERQAQNVRIIGDEDIEIDLTGNEDTEKKLMGKEQCTFHCEHCLAEFLHKSFLLNHVCMKEPAAKKSTGTEHSGKEQSTEIVILTDEEEGNDDDNDKEDDGEEVNGKHICPICSEPFTQKENLIIHHVKLHTKIFHLLNKREKPYGCDYCPSSYDKHQDLKLHMRSHTGERPFKCLDCPSAFASKPNLKTHMRLHTGNHPFKCHVCSSGFLTKVLLNRHRIRCDKDQAWAKANNVTIIYTNGSTSTDVPVTKPTDFCSNSYKRDFCPSSYDQHQDLKLHTTSHTGERPFKCLDCPRAFARKDNLKTHMRLHTS